jgi:3-oxoacyl-[acyl-carrier-protein] synthase II
MSRRVVITGLGAVSGLGIGTDAMWSGLVEGRTAISRITRFDPSGFRSRLAAEVKNFSVKDYVPKYYRKATKVMARDIELAVGAAKLAVEDAGLITRAALADPSAPPPADSQPAMTYRPARMGCHIGAGLVAAETEELTYALASARGAGAASVGGVDLGAWGRVGMDNLTPLWLLKYLPNMLACHVTILHGAEGPSNTITCAEASGLLSIGESTRVIERGAADLCFSGGAESKINLMGLLRMDLAGRLADTGDAADPIAFLRPYDASVPRPQGGLLGEGGGIVVLEEAETAQKRGARVYAEVLGFGAAHSFGEYEEGESDEGFRFAIEAALENAGVGAEKIDFILPLASGILPMDQAESGAIRAVFGARASEIPLVTITPNVGNCMAGMGGLQAAVAAKCLIEQRLPARLHGRTPTMGLDAATANSRQARLEYGLVCTGSLGGQNAALVLRKPANI